MEKGFAAVLLASAGAGGPAGGILRPAWAEPRDDADGGADGGAVRPGDAWWTGRAERPPPDTHSNLGLVLAHRG